MVIYSDQTRQSHQGQGFVSVRNKEPTKRQED